MSNPSYCVFMKKYETILELLSKPPVSGFTVSISEFEEKQNKLRALRNRQDLFQEEVIHHVLYRKVPKFS